MPQNEDWVAIIIDLHNKLVIIFQVLYTLMFTVMNATSKQLKECAGNVVTAPITTFAVFVI